MWYGNVGIVPNGGVPCKDCPKKFADRIMMNARSTGHTGQRLTRSTTSTTGQGKRTHALLSVRGIRHLLQSRTRTSTGDEMEELIIFLLGIFIGASLGVFLMALAIASRDDDEDQGER